LTRPPTGWCPAGIVGQVATYDTDVVNVIVLRFRGPHGKGSGPLPAQAVPLEADFGARIRFDKTAGLESFMPSDAAGFPRNTQLARQGFTVGRIRYSDGATGGRRPVTSQVKWSDSGMMVADRRHAASVGNRLPSSYGDGCPILRALEN
jgi:hypothetical protein